MTPYRKILCPIDFSDISRMALSWSRGLARELEAELTVLHVVDTALTNIGNLVAVPEATSELERQATTTMAEWRETLDLSNAHIAIEPGIPADVIVHSAQQMEADLLVMGTHGHSGLQKLLLGSVTEKVLHKAQIPLLAFSSKSPEPSSPGTILLALDLGPGSDAVVRHGLWLAEHYRARLIVAHVVSVPYVVLNDRTVERLGTSQLEALKSSLSAEADERLASLVPESGIERELTTLVGSPFDALRGVIEDRDVDLVVMGAGGHGRSGLGWVGSTCHKLVRSARCPVLIVR